MINPATFPGYGDCGPAIRDDEHEVCSICGDEYPAAEVILWNGAVLCPECDYRNRNESRILSASARRQWSPQRFREYVLQWLDVTGQLEEFADDIERENPEPEPVHCRLPGCGAVMRDETPKAGEKRRLACGCGYRLTTV